MNGIERIRAERLRQIEIKRWTPEHDDAHIHKELNSAAVAYAAANLDRREGGTRAAYLAFFPEKWNEAYWKPSNDSIRNLEKAGALIAAEIDRLLRIRNTES